MQKKYNILISTATLGSGGTERVISTLSPYLANNFHKITLILWKKEKEFYKIDNRINIIYLSDKCRSKNLLGKFKWFRSYIKENNPDIILSFLYPYSIRVILSLIGINTKIIVAERRDPRIVKGGSIIRYLRDLLYIKATRIFVQSYFNKSQYPSFLQKKIEVLYNPIKINKRYYLDRKNLPIKKEIVTVGRLIPIKNHKLLIDAFCIFHLTHPNYILNIWGEGPSKDKLIQYSKNKGLELNKNIYFSGNSKNILNDIFNTKAFILTSKSEGMPNALFEAVCAGIPCISTKVTGVIDLLKDNINVLLVDNSAIQIAKAMTTIVDNPKIEEDLSKAGRDLYKLLEPNKVAQQWIEAIKITCME